MGLYSRAYKEKKKVISKLKIMRIADDIREFFIENHTDSENYKKFYKYGRIKNAK